MTPLEGLRIVVTRAAHQAEELAHLLREQGAAVLLVPVIAIAPPSNPEPLRAAARSDKYDWIIFTSANAVSAFAQELRRMKKICRARIAVIGSGTREAAEACHLHVSVMPERYVAESLVEALGLPAGETACPNILIPSAAVTRDVVAPALRQRGAQVDVVEAYRNVLPPGAMELVRSVFQQPYPDWITFASPSAVTNLVNLAGTDIVQKSKLASIGPVTSAKIREFGLTVEAEAGVHNMSALVEAIIERARSIN